MEPQVKGSLVQGFHAANKSWLGIGFYAGGMLLLTAIVVLGVIATNPPEAIFEDEAAVGDVAQQEPVGAVADGASSLIEEEGRADAARQWLAGAWPTLLLVLLLAVGGNIWFSGGQIGYVTKQVTGPPVALSEFWTTATRAFVPLLGGWLLILAGLAGLALALTLITALLGVLPDTLSAILGFGMVIALVLGLVWLIVRLAFWFIIIVADRQGPLAALKASFGATHGRWLRIAGLGLLVILISIVASLPFTLLEQVGGAIGGGGGAAIGLLGSVGGIVVSLYIAFLMLGAFVRFYEDTKSTSAGPGTSSP